MIDPPKKPSNVSQAFQEAPNILGIAGLIGLSAATLNPLPLILGLVGEAAYLLFVPDSPWYQRRMEAKYDAEVRKRREDLKLKVFPGLSEAQRQRFHRLEEMRNRLQPPEKERAYYRNVFKRLDYLLEKYLLFAGKRAEFIHHIDALIRNVRGETKEAKVISNRPPPIKKSLKAVELPRMVARDEAWIENCAEELRNHYESQLEKLNKQRNNEENLHNQALLDKRIEIIGRRKLYAERLGGTVNNLDQQLQLMEDAIGLIGDEIRARSPEQVLADIESVVFQSESLTERLQELAPFEESELDDDAERLYS